MDYDWDNWDSPRFKTVCGEPTIAMDCCVIHSPCSRHTEAPLSTVAMKPPPLGLWHAKPVAPTRVVQSPHPTPLGATGLCGSWHHHGLVVALTATLQLSPATVNPSSLFHLTVMTPTNPVPKTPPFLSDFNPLGFHPLSMPHHNLHRHQARFANDKQGVHPKSSLHHVAITLIQPEPVQKLTPAKGPTTSLEPVTASTKASDPSSNLVFNQNHLNMGNHKLTPLNFQPNSNLTLKFHITPNSTLNFMKNYDPFSFNFLKSHFSPQYLQPSSRNYNQSPPTTRSSPKLPKLQFYTVFFSMTYLSLPGTHCAPDLEE